MRKLFLSRGLHPCPPSRQNLPPVRPDTGLLYSVCRGENASPPSPSSEKTHQMATAVIRHRSVRGSECNGDFSTKTNLQPVTSGSGRDRDTRCKLRCTGSGGVNAHSTRIRSCAPRWLASRAVHRIVCLPTHTAHRARAIASQFAAACAAANIDTMATL